MKIDIVICTYNRPEKVLELINQLVQCMPKVSTIIIIDSSDEQNLQIQKIERVKYIQSTHKNQPFQRYLGCLSSDAEYLLFLDDDMEILVENLFDKLSQLIQNNDASSFALNFKDKHKDTTLAAIPKSKIGYILPGIAKFKNWFTGYPTLSAGKLGLCGNKGRQPQSFAKTEYVSGGAFLARRSFMFKNFNFQLFDLFEQRLGMGEDTIIGYSLSCSGNLLFVPEIYFTHNDQKDSTYSFDKMNFSKRVLFSRLFLSLDLQRMRNKSILLGKVHFHWYAMWRVLGLLINFMIRPNSTKKLILIGALKGWRLTWKFHFNKSESNDYWIQEAQTNLK